MSNEIIKICFYASGFFHITPKKAYSFLTSSDAILLDVRDPDYLGYKKFDVPNIQYLFSREIDSRWNEVPKNKIVIVADSVGIRSREVLNYLCDMGFENVINLAGGIVEWERDGMPLNINIKERLEGSCACKLRPRKIE